jgi:hypothetical protein
MKKTISLWAFVCVCLFGAWQFAATGMPRFKLVSPAYGFCSNTLGVYNCGPDGGGCGTTTWHPSDKNANVTLSGANLIATASGGAGGIRAIASHSSGKYYAEFTVNAETSLLFTALANGSSTLATYPGVSDANAISMNCNDGNVWLNGANPTGSPVSSCFQGGVFVGNVVSMAVDLGNNAIWWRVNNLNWNNSGTANPATNTGGISMSGINAGPYYPLWFGGNTNDQVTANFGGSAYTETVPAALEIGNGPGLIPSHAKKAPGVEFQGFLALVVPERLSTKHTHCVASR